jgi:hypothetical protein
MEFVEKRDLLRQLPDEARQLVQRVVVPLRHLEWGANMNNAARCPPTASAPRSRRPPAWP